MTRSLLLLIGYSTLLVAIGLWVARLVTSGSSESSTISSGTTALP